MLQWVHDLAQWMVGLAQTPAGPVGLFGLAVAEASFFPIPPDLLLLALCLVRPSESFLFAAICTAGSTVGGMLGFAIGRWGGRPLLERLVSAEKILLIERQFHKHDVWAVAIAGFTPIPYKLFTIAGGAFRLHFWRFAIVSVCSRGARFFLVATVVYVFGEQANRLVRDYFDVLTVGFAILLIGGFLVLRLAGRRYAASRDT